MYYIVIYISNFSILCQFKQNVGLAWSLSKKGPSSSWSYDSWIYNYLCNQWLSPLTLWVRIPLSRGILNATLCDKVCHWLMADRWFSPGTLISPPINWPPYDITEKLLKVAVITITLTPKKVGLACSPSNKYNAQCL